MIEINQIKINPKLPKWTWWQYLIIFISLVLLLKGENKLLLDLVAHFLKITH